MVSQFYYTKYGSGIQYMLQPLDTPKFIITPTFSSRYLKIKLTITINYSFILNDQENTYV